LKIDKKGETTAQREVSSPQTEAEVDPSQIIEAQISQTQTLKKIGREKQLPLKPSFRQGEEEDEFRKQLKQFRVQQNSLKNFKILQNSLNGMMFNKLGK
jgi:hypothetical protein